MPTATFHHEATVPLPPERVWSALQRPGTWEHVGPVERVWAPEHDAEGTLLGYRWTADIGGRPYEGHARTVIHDRPRRFVVDLDGGEMGGRIDIALTPESDATRAAVALEIRSQGMLSALAFPAIRMAIAAGFPDQVRHLVERLAAD